MAWESRTGRRIAWAAVLAAACGLAVSHGAVVVSSGSMEPAVHSGDVVVYRKAGSRLNEGEMLVFARPGDRMPVVHRVVRVMPDGQAVTRGDANPVEDREPLSSRDVRGGVVVVIPTGGLVRALAVAARDARLTYQSQSTKL